MNKDALSLNLSRKWRSQNFDQIIGQDLVVRIIKNSLYRNVYFPVYLFSGQRGCGKTSTARIFAAALNCSKLADFQKNPKNISIPCLECVSCCAIKEGKHPDFIEIDAASHTGVDNMRNIIESSSLLPTMGKKRIYLIDEAHMLSKAAFNAALKVLEEPSPSAVFILATTNPYKIIDTVKSRSFQLFFSAVEHHDLKKHLEYICKQENIVYEDAALDIIIRHTQGSVRDALNALEQARLYQDVVDEKSVLYLFAYLHDTHIFSLILYTIQGNVQELLHLFLTLSLQQYNMDYVWERILSLLRIMIWKKYDVKAIDTDFLDENTIKEVQCFSLSGLCNMLQILCHNEDLFVKTPRKHLLLEFILLQICQNNSNSSDSGQSNSSSSLVKQVDNSTDEQIDELMNTDIALKDVSFIESPVFDCQTVWNTFIEHMRSHEDQLLYSIFKQSSVVSYDAFNKKIFLQAPKDFILFSDYVNTTKPIWLSALSTIFSCRVDLVIEFTGPVLSTHGKADNKVNSKTEQLTQQAPAVDDRLQPQKFIKSSAFKKSPVKAVQHEKIVDVSRTDEWPTATMLLSHFPGVIIELREKV